MAVEGADIKLSELAIGIGPFVIGPAVERKIGLAAFSQLCINATHWHTAAWAKEKGLFAELHPSEEALDKSVDGLARILATYSPNEMAELKAALWQGTGHWNELLQERAAISGGLAVNAFTRRRLQILSGNSKSVCSL